MGFSDRMSNIAKKWHERRAEINPSLYPEEQKQKSDMKKRITEGENVGVSRTAEVEKKPAKKAKAKSEYKMPKSTTPDMDTTQGNTGSRNSFDAGEVNPFAPRAAAEKLIDYPSRTADAPTPAEVADIVKAKDDSRFSTSNPLGMKKGGKVKCMSSGGSSKASSRGDGCAQRGKTRGRMI